MNTAIAVEAARWFARLRDGVDDTERTRFETWLSSHPEHAAAFAGISRVWDQMDSASGSARLANAVRGQARQSRRRAIGGLAGLAIGALGLWLFRSWQGDDVLWQLASAVGSGSSKRVDFEDGGSGLLGAGSAIEVRYTSRERRLTLLRGEILLDVTRDTRRPFVVDSGLAKVTVLGTRFAVQRLSDRVRVSVVHGRVRLEKMSGSEKESGEAAIELTDGDVGEMDGRSDRPALLKTGWYQAGDALALERGQIVFRQATPSEVSETLSRWRGKPVRVTALGDSHPRINAVVQVNGIDDFLATLPQASRVRVDQ